MARTIGDIRAQLQDPIGYRKQKFNEEATVAQIQLQRDRYYAEQERNDLMREQIEQRGELEEKRIEASIESTRIAGENARALSLQEFIQSEWGKNTDLLHSMAQSNLDQKRDWNNSIADIKKMLYGIEANMIVSEQAHKHDMEKMILAHVLRKEETRGERLSEEELKATVAEAMAAYE